MTLFFLIVNKCSVIVYSGAGTHSIGPEDPVMKKKQGQRGQMQGTVTKHPRITVFHDTCLSNSINTLNNNIPGTPGWRSR